MRESSNYSGFSQTSMPAVDSLVWKPANTATASVLPTFHGHFSGAWGKKFPLRERQGGQVVCTVDQQEHGSIATLVFKAPDPPCFAARVVPVRLDLVAPLRWQGEPEELRAQSHDPSEQTSIQKYVGARVQGACVCVCVWVAFCREQ